MPGYSSQQLANKVQNANACTIAIGDQIVAYAQTVTHSFGFGTEGLYGVGTAKPQEIQQMKNAPQISIENFALSKLGLQITAGGAVLSQLLGNSQFNISIIDGINNETLLIYFGGVSQDFNETIAANRPVTDTYTFLCLDVLDPIGNSLLSGQNAIIV